YAPASPDRNHPGAARCLHRLWLQDEGPDLRRLHQRRLRQVLRRKTMSRFGYTLAILASTVLAPACTDEIESTNTPPPGSTSGGETTTFDHDNSTISPWELLDRLQQEGPPSFTSRMHSCPKVRYATLGTVLTQIGVNT